ncbi:MAG: sulfurtransferase TusA family protein [Gammaproteobacteria bacterium]|nr:sulfurtransferase TusA family protein [Gammaproteobacteria bacterium]
MEYQHFIDIKNMCCAEPIVLLTKRIKTMSSGDVLMAESNSISMIKDIPAYCSATHHDLVKQEELNGLYHFWIKVK